MHDLPKQEESADSARLTRQIPGLVLVQVDLPDSYGMETGIRNLFGQVMGDELLVSGLEPKSRRQFHDLVLAPAKNRNTIFHLVFDHLMNRPTDGVDQDIRFEIYSKRDMGPRPTGSRNPTIKGKRQVAGILLGNAR